jgi:hypothetical protein
MRTNYGWVVVALGALMTCVAVGAMFSLAVFLQPITEAAVRSRAWTTAACGGAIARPRSGQGEKRLWPVRSRVHFIE